MTTDQVALAIMIGTLGCTAYTAPSLDPGPEAPAVVRTGCALVVTRCSRCHSIERVLAARVESPVQWQRYVRRMRLVPASGIAPAEERLIVTCLVRRSFGNEGLAALQPQEDR